MSFKYCLWYYILDGRGKNWVRDLCLDLHSEVGMSFGCLATL